MTPEIPLGADNTQVRMLVELEKLHNPLLALKDLSRCLPDSPGIAAIRNSISAVMFRAAALETEIRLSGDAANRRDVVLGYFDAPFGTT